MEQLISISYPKYLADSLKMSGNEFEYEMKMSSLAKLFELGKISSGTAARILGMSRIDFLEQLAKYKVSVFNYADENSLKEDLLNA